jgi:hypothetical protein
MSAILRTQEEGLERTGEELPEAGADEDAVARSDTDEPGYNLQQELLAQF